MDDNNFKIVKNKMKTLDEIAKEMEGCIYIEDDGKKYLIVDSDYETVDGVVTFIYKLELIR